MALRRCLPEYVNRAPLAVSKARLRDAPAQSRDPGILTVLDQNVEALLDQKGCVEDDEAER